MERNIALIRGDIPLCFLRLKMLNSIRGKQHLIKFVVSFRKNMEGKKALKIYLNLELHFQVRKLKLRQNRK